MALKGKKFKWFAITLSVLIILSGVGLYCYIDLIPSTITRKAHAPDPYFDKVYGHGIDLSHHNPEPNWDKLNVDFVILKATEGSGFTDPTYRRRLRECRQRNIPVGAYHFFKASASQKAEFNKFKSVIGKDFDIIPVLDIETRPKGVSKKEFQNRFRQFLILFKKEYGCWPIIYAGEEFYLSNLKKTVDNVIVASGNKPLLWFGNIGRKYKKYALTPHIHQAHIKHVKGISAKIDYNELHCKMKDILYRH